MTTFTTQGTIIARGDAASPEVFTTIPQVTNIDPVGQDRSLIDVTNLSSTSREYKKAIKDGKEINLDIQYDPKNAVHTNLRTDKDAETSVNFRITLTDSPATTITFAALVTNYDFGIPIDEVYPLRVTLKPTGDLAYA